jgi:hypothetical protein
MQINLLAASKIPPLKQLPLKSKLMINPVSGLGEMRRGWRPPEDSPLPTSVISLFSWSCRINRVTDEGAKPVKSASSFREIGAFSRIADRSTERF